MLEVNWNVFEEKSGNDPRSRFEDLTYQLFCMQLNITEGLVKRINQPFIETDPVEVNGKKIGFQSKYFDTSTTLNDRSRLISEEIQGMSEKYPGISVVYLYVNKELTTSSSPTEVKPAYQVKIEKLAYDCNIKIEWFTKNRIEFLLKQPQFSYIRYLFFESNPNTRNELMSYYRYVNGIYTSMDREAELVGKSSLREAYIDAYYVDQNDQNKSHSIIKELENWRNTPKDPNDDVYKNRICIIHGQPGHGKTSLCIYAVCAFFRNSIFQKYDYQAVGTKLAGNAGRIAKHMGGMFNNVFWFSLNPLVAKKIINYQSKSIDLRMAFCWGVEGENDYFARNVSELKDSLVFLDGYDELIVRAAQVTRNAKLRDFIAIVNDYAVQYNISFVITSRTASIKNELYNLPEDLNIKVMQLAAISKEQQVSWMKKRNISQDYISIIANVNNQEMQKLLGVPILFRMIVNDKISDLNSKNAIGIYDKLFQKTMARHRIPEADVKHYHKELEEIAYKMFCMNSEVIPYAAESPIKSIGYTYYIEVDEILGFYHRSFYQYFLSYYIYQELSDISDEHKAEKFLKSFAFSVFDAELLNKLLEINRIEKRSKVSQIKLLFNIIDKTDAVILVDELETSATRLVLCNYAYYNILNIANTFGYPLRRSEHKRSCDLLKWYDIRGVKLDYIVLDDASFSRTNFDGIIARHSKLNNINLSYTSLKNTILNYSELKDCIFFHSTLRNAQLKDVEMVNSDLSNAELIDSDMSNSVIQDGTWVNTVLRAANFTRASFNNIEFKDTDFSNTHLIDTCFEKCIIPNCEFYGASCGGVKFIHCTLSELDLNHKNIQGSSFFHSVLNNVQFNGAYAVGADFSEVTMRKTSFRQADLRNGNFIGGRITECDFSGSNLFSTDFSDAVLINTKISSENVSGYYSSTKVNGMTKWTNVEVYLDSRREDLEQTRKFFEEQSIAVHDLLESLPSNAFYDNYR